MSGGRRGADDLLDYCLGKPGAWADTPWGDDPVIKVGPRIFAFLGPDSIGVKAGSDRDTADEWIARFPDAVDPMPYLGRRGWNRLRVDASIPARDLREAVDLSYDLVVAALPRRLRP